MTSSFMVKLVDANKMNRLLVKHHYLHRAIVRSKLLAYGVYNPDNQLIGGLVWCTPPMGKKRNLFGYAGLYDRWEVITLGRFYLGNGSNLVASAVLAECIGRQVKIGKHGKIIKQRGWRIQEDWVKLHPPIYPNMPFVPRLLLSWSDVSLPTVEQCSICGRTHNGNHVGTIYKASGWSAFDITRNTKKRNGGQQQHEGNKQSWIMPLNENALAHSMGLKLASV